MADYIKREDAINAVKQKDSSKEDPQPTGVRPINNNAVHLANPLHEIQGVINMQTGEYKPQDDVVDGEMYRTVLNKMNEYADTILKMREILGVRKD